MYPGNEINILVLDNCSTDETKKLLSTITDPRFSFVQNESNIGGVPNLLKCLSLPSGKFAFLCLDKDYLNYQSVEKLIERCKSDPEVVFGHCALNIQQETPDIVYDKQYQSIVNMAYLSKHPTGVFYKTDIYANLTSLKTMLIEQSNFPFCADVINADMAMLGKSKLINLPAFYTEKTDEARHKPSFTYNASNIYFSPAKRLLEFETYLNSAQQLGLSNYETLKLIGKIYSRELMLSTFVYKKMMSDHAVCDHHRINTRKIGYSEIFKLSFVFTLHFLKKDISINLLDKTIIVLYGYIKFIARIVLLK